MNKSTGHLFRLINLSLVAFVLNSSRVGASEQQQKIADANTEFAFKLLTELNKESPGQNIFISPYSVSTVLQMVCNGATGQTLDEMNQVFGIAELSPGARNAAVRDVLNSINNHDTNVVLNAANAIWIRTGISVNPGFNSCNAQFFGSTIGTLDLSSPQSMDSINAWAKEKTHGKITSVMAQPLRPEDFLFLANVVYFKANWLDQFRRDATKERIFHLAGGRQKNVSMMEKWRPDFVYRRGTGYQAVRLPYKAPRLGMYVFLPDPGSNPDALIRTITADRWKKVTRPGFQSREGFLVLPRFSARYQAQLERALNALGICRAFQKTAEFSGITPGPLWISAILQQAVVEVNEEGTEAAAFTGIPMTGGLDTRPKPFEMIVDRPFFFLIHDGLTDSILFMGIVYDPGAAS